MGRRPFLRTLPSWVLCLRKFPGKMLPLALRLVFLLYCLGLSPDMGSIPSTIPPTDADSLAAVILSTFAELTPEVTSVPLELTAAYSKCRAGITAYSTVNAYSPGRAIQTNPPKARK